MSDTAHVPDCPFCRIARHESESVLVYENANIMAFLDIAPIRPAHTLIIPKLHVDAFENLADELAAEIITFGQRLARHMKTVYAVERVAFLFTGSDVPHAHAHVVPMHETTDITSARYLLSKGAVEWSSLQLRTDFAELRRMKEELGFT